MRVVFMGTPDFAVPALRAILAAGHDVIAVYTQPPRPKGRGQAVQKSPVHVLAEEVGIPVHTPKSLRKDPAAVETFCALQADVAVVAAYGLILPQSVLDAPRFGCLNIHGSILPRWRGAAPIQYAVWKGDAETGVTIMQMAAGLDTGPMIDIKRVPITDTTTTTELYVTLADLGARAVCDVLAALPNITTIPQDDAQATLAGLLAKSDGVIDWTQTAQQISCQVRGLNPWPGTMTTNHAGQRLKVLEADIGVAGGHSAPGTVIDATGAVACGNGTTLILRCVQPDNSRKMDIAAAVNGRYLLPGTVLGGGVCCSAGN